MTCFGGLNMETELILAVLKFINSVLRVGMYGKMWQTDS